MIIKFFMVQFGKRISKKGLEYWRQIAASSDFLNLIRIVLKHFLNQAVAKVPKKVQIGLSNNYLFFF